MRRAPPPASALAVAMALAALIGPAPAVAVAKARPAPARPPAVRADDAPDVVTYGAREDVVRFGDELAARRGLDPAWVQASLQRARYLPSVARYIMPPPAGTAKNWAAYRARFVEPRRIEAGAAFWRANAAWLQQAEATWGVPPEIVVGILGVETLYGQQMGDFRVIDALASLSFDFPAGRKDRSAFFRDELENLFVWCQREGIDPLRPTGSFAGAIGMPQFMPSSLNRYAVDLDGDGRIDLRGSSADVIGSVAHYLAEFGWKRRLPTRFEVAVPVDAAERATLLGPDILPTFTTADFAAHGAKLADAAIAADAGLADTGGLGPLALVELQNGSAAPTYVAGTANFYAITRYNWSSYYAMAVIELGEAIGRRVRAGTGEAR